MYNFEDLVDVSSKNQRKRKLLVPENITTIRMMCHFISLYTINNKPFQQYISFTIFYIIFNGRKYVDILMLQLSFTTKFVNGKLNSK